MDCAVAKTASSVARDPIVSAMPRLERDTGQARLAAQLATARAALAAVDRLA
jgi:hypothetical protein